MGNKISSPFPSYESACSSLNPMEIIHLKQTFKTISKNSESINLLNFTQVNYLSYYYRIKIVIHQKIYMNVTDSVF